MNNLEPISPERRKWLTKLSLWLTAAGAAIIATPVGAFLIGPLAESVRRQWRDVGSVGDFQKGQTTEVKYADASSVPWAGVTGQTAAWLRYDETGQFTAFAINCTHLGCPVRWIAKADLFMCPCHGGVYYSDGSVAAGPPPKPLTRYPVRVQDGKVQILTTPTPIA